MPVKTPIDSVFPDPSNPRQSDPVRLHLLRLSLQKLGFVQPIYCAKDGMILSGHQRHKVAKELGFKTLPVEYVDLPEKQMKGINVLFNRATNDFTAFDTGATSSDRLDIGELMASAEELEDWEGEDFLAYSAKMTKITGLGGKVKDEYNRKSMLVTATLRRYGIKIPLVLSEDGEVINGVHRLFEARHVGINSWPAVRLDRARASFAADALNYLSMDYAVDGEFARVLRYSAYRRPQNARGILPKAMRFWACGERTLKDSETYTTEFWENFRLLHGINILDFGSGLGRASEFLRQKGFNCLDFEPYCIPRLQERPENNNVSVKRPDSEYSRRRIREFLQSIGGNDAARQEPDDKTTVGYSEIRFDSIFLASVLNSVPFAFDRQCVLAIVHALSSFETITYGTCRDISDFLYEYSGIRNATYFVFDSEPGVRLGDALSNPKIQKFHSQEEFKAIAGHFWKTVETWPGGNVFYWRASNPKRINSTALKKAIEFEFDLPYSDGTSMNLVDEAKAAFSARLGIKL